MPDSNQKIQGINQEFKEKEIQKKAEDMGIPYINLLDFKVNPDVLQLIKEEESKLGHLVVFFQIGKKIRVALSDPQNFKAQEIVQRLKNERFAVNINLASEESITQVQSFYQSPLIHKEKKENIELEKEDIIASEALKNFEETQEKQLSTESSSDALSHIHGLAVQMNASDIHFQIDKDQVPVRFRIDGMLQTVSQLDFKTYEGILKQIKFNAHMKLNITNQAQEGQYVFTVNERGIDVRVSTLPSIYGESAVLRLLDPKKGVVPLSDLGFKKYALEKIATVLSKQEGMILLAGPTGAGKTTTLYSVLDVLNRPHRKIITLEDPVEYKLENIVQCEVHINSDQFSYQDGLIAALRQDPDVIMVGEIREPKVASTAIQAAMTGHLVLSTIHTNSAIDSIARLQHLGVPEYLLAPALNAVVSQRLLRRICPHCKSSRPWKTRNKEVLSSTFERLQAKLGLTSLFPEQESFGKGCEHCNQSGYLGRITIAEIFVITPSIRELIQKRVSESELLTQAITDGFITLREDAMLKVLEGDTTFDEVMRILG